MHSIWHELREGDVQRRRSIPEILLQYGKSLLGVGEPKGLYDLSPLRGLIRKHLLGASLKIPLHVGLVDLHSGQYHSEVITGRIRREDIKKIMASAAIPLIYDPIKLGGSYFVDGGVRNIAPISNLLPHDPQMVIIVPTSPLAIENYRGPPNTPHEIAHRSLEILMNEVSREDIKRFQRINSLVAQAEEQGATLEAPLGREYKYYSSLLIPPSRDLGDSLDFSPQTIKSSLSHGRIRARNKALSF